jgi:hypothetical protein
MAMSVTCYETADAFLAVTQAYLMEQECLNGLMLGLCFSLKQGLYQEYPPLLLAAMDEEGLAATAVCTPPHHLVVYSTREDCQSAMSQLAQHLAEEKLPGVRGPSLPARLFAESWQTQTGRPYRSGMRQCVYELRQVEFVPDVPGYLRQARAEEFALLVAWTTGFHQDAFGRADEENVRKSAKRHLDSGSFYIWEDGHPVSVAAKTRETPHGRTVSLVYTPPEFRRQGYATACVAVLSQQLLTAGYDFCTLFTDLANPTSNRIYQKIGYRPIANFDEYTFSA